MQMCIGKDHVVSPILNGARCSCGKEWRWENYIKAHNAVNEEPKKKEPWQSKPNFSQ